MKRSIVEQYSEHALDYLAEDGIKEINEENKELNPNAAAFGPTVLSIGLLPTILHFQEDDKGRWINAAIWKILEKDVSLDKHGCRDIIEYAKTGNVDDAALRRNRILAASTALKHALRTLPEVQESQQETASVAEGEAQ